VEALAPDSAAAAPRLRRPRRVATRRSGCADRAVFG
jgi:hypothetical protein